MYVHTISHKLVNVPVVEAKRREKFIDRGTKNVHTATDGLSTGVTFPD